MDMIWLYGIECRSRIGVTSRERGRAQKILIDVGMELDLAPSAARDDFRLTADYQAVEKAARETAETGEMALVETLAERVAAAVLRREKSVLVVRVIVHKKPAVMRRTREVVVEIRRSRKA